MAKGLKPASNYVWNGTKWVKNTSPSTEAKQDSILAAIKGNFMLEVAESGVYTYIGKAPIASSTASAVWQIKRVDETSCVEIKWADGDSNFDNTWDNYASLTYN